MRTTDYEKEPENNMPDVEVPNDIVGQVEVLEQRLIALENYTLKRINALRARIDLIEGK
jgi:hypothetical protein